MLLEANCSSLVICLSPVFTTADLRSAAHGKLTLLFYHLHCNNLHPGPGPGLLKGSDPLMNPTQTSHPDKLGSLDIHTDHVADGRRWGWPFRKLAKKISLTRSFRAAMAEHF